jgi:hypothetical protein
MRATTEEKLLAALADRDGGATAKQLAAQLGWPQLRTSQHLGNLFFAGKLERDLVDVTRRRSTEYVYRIKPAKPLSPPTQWKPESPRLPAAYGETATADGGLS